MKHPCARCSTPTDEEKLVWHDGEDDFVCEPCDKRSTEIKRRHGVRKVNVQRRLAELKS